MKRVKQENENQVKEELKLIDYANLIVYFVIFCLTVKLEYIPQIWLWPILIPVTLLYIQKKRNFIGWLELILAIFILVFNTYLPNIYIFLALSGLMILRFMIFIKHNC
jgi:hypothetical protein